jgi:ferric-dicitrate binding protein FerR (iron transport regulator)
MRRILPIFMIAALPARLFAAPAVPDSSSVSARISSCTGSTQVRPGGSDIWFPAKSDRRLPPGSRVKTSGGSSCTVLLSDGTKLRVGHATVMRLETLDPDRVTAALDSGRLEAWVTKAGSRTFQVRSALATVSGQGAVFGMDVLGAASARVDVFAGEVSVQDLKGGSVKVADGQRLVASATGGLSRPAPLPEGTVQPVEPSLTPPAPAVKKPAPKGN